MNERLTLYHGCSIVLVVGFYSHSIVLGGLELMS